MEKVKKSNENAFIIYVIAISVIVFFIVLIRAATTAITWDEAYTYIVYAKDFSINQLINIHSNYANNHIINTIMIAVLDNLCKIEYNEFIIRIPNLIMLVFYFIGSYMISKDEKHKFLLFSALVLNYYVMEFFGLGRGYGISTTFIIFMCYFFRKSFNNQENDKNIFKSILFGILACYSNTVCILALFSISTVYIIQLLIKKDMIRFIRKNIIKILPIMLLLIYILIFHFIVTGSDKPVFGEEDGTTIMDLMKGNFVWMFFENPIINITITIVIVIILLISIYKEKLKILKRPYLMLLFVTLFSLIIPSFVFRKPFLVKRCLIPFWPIIVLGFIEIYDLFIERRKEKNIILTGIAITLFIINFTVRTDITSTRTWKNNYIVRNIAYNALYERRTLTKEEYEENKSFYGLSFYREKILKDYKFDIIPQ